MKKSGSSDFNSIKELLQTIDFSREIEKQRNIIEIEKLYEESAGEKFSRVSRVCGISSGVLTLACADAGAACALYMEKKELLNKMNKKAANMGIKIKDIKFDYKKWKERNYE